MTTPNNASGAPVRLPNTVQQFPFAENPGDESRVLHFTTAQTQTVFPGFIGLQIEGQRYDPLGHQLISTVGFSPHLLSHVDLPTEDFVSAAGQEDLEPTSPLSHMMEYRPLVVESVLLDVSTVAARAAEWMRTRVWGYEAKDDRSDNDHTEAGYMGHEFADPATQLDDLATLHADLEIDLEEALAGQSVEGRLVLIATDRQRYAPAFREISSSFWGGWHIAWFYPYIGATGAQWLIEQGAVGIATDAYSIDSFAHTIREGSFSPGARQLVVRCAEAGTTGPERLRGGPAHRALLQAGKVVAECLTIPKSAFERDVDRVARMRERLRAQGHAPRATVKPKMRTICGRTMMVPFFVVPRMSAIVVLVEFAPE